MAKGKHGRHKQTKMGELPGDIARSTKIEMLEKRTITLGAYEVGSSSFSEASEERRVKTYRKMIADQAESRFRQGEKAEIEKELEELEEEEH